MGDSEATQFAMDWYGVLHDAGWKMQDKIVTGFMIMGGVPFAGIKVKVSGKVAPEPQEKIEVPATDPRALLGRAFENSKIPFIFETDPSLPEGMIRLEV